jgi:hypothetical protein
MYKQYHLQKHNQNDRLSAVAKKIHSKASIRIEEISNNPDLPIGGIHNNAATLQNRRLGKMQFCICTKQNSLTTTPALLTTAL